MHDLHWPTASSCRQVGRHQGKVLCLCLVKSCLIFHGLAVVIDKLYEDTSITLDGKVL